MWEQSQRCHDRAVVIPGRSLTRSKAPGRYYPVGSGPLYAVGGHGAMIETVDGTSMIDMVCALGAISLGYGARPIRASREVARGWVYSLPSPLEAEAAERLLRVCAPWASRCRFVKTGSEALQAAVMIARAWTRRPAVLVADSAYHGWHDWMAASYNGLGRVSGSQMFRWGADDVWPNGVPCAYTQGIAVYKYGDLDDLLAAVARIGEKNVAAVLVEPARWRATTLGQMVDVRAWCSERGALMILDEMIYGGRWRKGGGAEYFGVTPDLACFGKAIANGAPIACVVGNDPLDAHGQQVSGTYSGDAASLAAVDDTLAVYESEPVIERLWAVGEHLARGLWKLADAFNDDAGEVRVECEGAFVHQRMRFTDPDLGRRFSAQMAARSVLWHPECVNVSYAHTKEHVDAVLRCAQEAFEEIKT